jgi:hypothetical protein
MDLLSALRKHVLAMDADSDYFVTRERGEWIVKRKSDRKIASISTSQAKTESEAIALAVSRGKFWNA